jgi:hypothetical protein
MAFLFYEFLPSNSFAVDISPAEQIRIFLSNKLTKDVPIENPFETRLSLETKNSIKEENKYLSNDSITKHFGVELTNFLNRILREGLSISNMGIFFRLFEYSNGNYEMLIRGHKPLIDKLFRELHPLLINLVKSGVTLRLQSKFFFRMFDSYLFLFYCISHRDKPNSKQFLNPFHDNDSSSSKNSQELFDFFFDQLLLDQDAFFEIFQFLFCFAYKDLRLSLHQPLNPIFKKLKNIIFTIFKQTPQDIK